MNEFRLTARCKFCDWTLVDDDDGDPVERARAIRERLIGHVEQEHGQPGPVGFRLGP
jgi:hypothetical protein